jgi:dihydroorotate dehydrogenase (fumarate)
VQYIDELQDTITANQDLPRLPFGLKTPPYTHSTEFETLIGALLRSSTKRSPEGQCPVSFITATNTLGSCLVFSTPDGSEMEPLQTGTVALPGSGLGGMAGAPLHPLALGNVATLRRMLDGHAAKLGHIRIVGIGGVLDAAGYLRMRKIGASVVGVGTGLGLKGLKAFEKIEETLGGKW